eukprot:COSAG06_NODE_3404_length_5394_cov_6.648914_8_plen_163_part_00
MYCMQACEERWFAGCHLWHMPDSVRKTSCPEPVCPEPVPCITTVIRSITGGKESSKHQLQHRPPRGVVAPFQHFAMVVCLCRGRTRTTHTPGTSKARPGAKNASINTIICILYIMIVYIIETLIYIYKTIILPRQAWDKHGENSNEEAFSQAPPRQRAPALR